MILALLRGGLDVLWIDADAVMLIDKDAIWMEAYSRPEAHAVLQRGQKVSSGSTTWCPGLAMYRWGGSGPAAIFLSNVLSGMMKGAEEGQAFGDAMAGSNPRWIAGGTDSDKDIAQVESKSKMAGGSFTVALLPQSHFPLADQNKGKDLPRWAYVYHESHSAGGAVRGKDVLERIRAQKFYFVEGGYADFPTVQDFEEWACSVLPKANPTRVIQAGFVDKCKEEELVRKREAGQVDDPFSGWEGATSEGVGLLEGSGVNPVVMQLSQVASPDAALDPMHPALDILRLNTLIIRDASISLALQRL